MRTYIETGTVDHVLAISAEAFSDMDFPGYVEITQFEGVCKHGRYHSLVKRLQDAWSTLRGNGRCWEEFYNAEDVDRLVEALSAARKEAFGPKEDWSDTNKGGA